MYTPQEIITRLFVATDARDWKSLENCFAAEVLLDYSSMGAGAATTLSPEQILSAWKAILPGFTHTHHQIGNVLSQVEGDTATVFCYGTASHYLESTAGNLWTVVGSYEFTLVRAAAGTWKVSQMRFNLKYQDGNLGLPQEAMKVVRAIK